MHVTSFEKDVGIWKNVRRELQSTQWLETQEGTPTPPTPAEQEGSRMAAVTMLVSSQFSPGLVPLMVPEICGGCMSSVRRLEWWG